MKAYIETRRQKAKGKWPKQGPDTYVAVQIVPDGVEPLKYLNYKVAAVRGIKIKIFGEGYSENSGPKSMLGIALKEAKNFVEKFNLKYSA